MTDRGDAERELTMFRPHKQGLRKMLGDLEAEVMEAIWRAPEGEPVTVREILAELNCEREAPYAYTTVMTVMGNLARKGLLMVNTAYRLHRYLPAMSREAFTSHAVGQIIDELLADFSEPAIAHFARAAGLSSEDALERARRKLAARKGQAGPEAP